MAESSVLWLKWNPASFLFYLEENGNTLHFKDGKSNEPFIQFDSTPFETLEMGWTEEGGELNILLQEEQRINLSFRSNGQSEFDFSKCPESEEKRVLNSNRLQFVRAEYWLVKPADPPKKQNKAESAPASNSLTKELIGTIPDVKLFGTRYQLHNCAMGVICSHPVYLLPAELKISEVRNLLSILGVHPNKHSIEGLGFWTEGMGLRCTNEDTL